MASSKMLPAVLIAAIAGCAAPSAHGQTPVDCDTAGPVGQPYRTGVNCRTVQVDGAARRFIVYVPRHRPVTGPLRPVVLMYHGSSGNGTKFLRISGWREQADEKGLVAIFPTGLRYRVLESGRRVTKWNDFSLADEIDLGERPPGYPEDAPMPADDVGFTDSIMGDVGRRLPIDPRRVYASGFSNGGAFAARLSVERSERLAAAAISGGSLHEAAAPARPVPTYLTAGTLDDRILEQTGPPPLAELPLNPFALLREPVVASTLQAHLDTLGLDRDRFGVLAAARSTELRWPASDPVFRFGLLAGVTHQYPNGRNNPAGFAVAPEFWEFFRGHRLPR
jgi:polyhydroxybutyrate depolymerase